MKNSNYKQHFITLALIALIGLSQSVFSQVGIGTLVPDPSSMLDLSSIDKGMLAPRMTAAQKIAIVNPADGLLVYDTTDNAFYFYDSSTWVRMPSEKRDNYKLIKSESDLSEELAAGGGSKYLLTSNTLYEINGVIALAQPIDLNNAYIMGLDTNEDILAKSGGTMFEGSSGGSIKGVTLSAPGGTIFNLTGTSADSFVFRDSIVANAASVGTIDGFGTAFLSIIQFSGNTTGITYNNITDLLLSNMGWFSNNLGTYETFTGTFSILEKQGGFSEIDGSAIGVDVSSNPTVGNGVILGTSFSGTSTEFVKRYTTGSYPGYNFDNAWTVNCPGIPVESDEVATGHIYYDGAITSGFTQSAPIGTTWNMAGNGNTNTTTAVNVLRATSPQDNRITYQGKKTRTFQISASISVKGNVNLGDQYAFFIRKNGITTLVETSTLMRVNVLADITSNSITGTVELAPNDYIEIWGQKVVGLLPLSSITVYSLNLNIK